MIGWQIFNINIKTSDLSSYVRQCTGKKVDVLNLKSEEYLQESKEEREESIKNAMQAIIDDFVKNPSKKEFHCSADLSTYERMILHDFAENAQLGKWFLVNTE